jgi:hypothetical protein
VVVKPPAPEQALNTDTAAAINSTLTTFRRMARFLGLNSDDLVSADYACLARGKMKLC